LRMRPPTPVPVTVDRSTPCSAASLRTSGVTYGPSADGAGAGAAGCSATGWGPGPGRARAAAREPEPEPGPEPGAPLSIRINEVESNGGTPADWVELKNRSAGPVNVSGWKILDGDPAHVLLDDSEHDDLLFTGSGGKGPFRRVLMGSVSTTLLREASCPVVIVPRGSGEGASS